MYREPLRELQKNAFCTFPHIYVCIFIYVNIFMKSLCNNLNTYIFIYIKTSQEIPENIFFLSFLY